MAHPNRAKRGSKHARAKQSVESGTIKTNFAHFVFPRVRSSFEHLPLSLDFFLLAVLGVEIVFFAKKHSIDSKLLLSG